MSQDIIPRKPSENTSYRKINEDGKYCLFPGVTVVSSVGSTNEDLWSEIYQTLERQKTITDHYALLPAESYHMTTINLYVAEFQKNWKNFIDQNLEWFQNFSVSIENETNFQPQVLSIYPQFHGGVLLLRIDIPEEQKRKNFELAQKYGLVGLIPDIQFHITLGYIYKRIPSNEVEQISRLFQDSVENILQNYSKPICFERPELTYFNDMTAFIPWKGEFNPFTDL